MGASLAPSIAAEFVVVPRLSVEGQDQTLARRLVSAWSSSRLVGTCLPFYAYLWSFKLDFTNGGSR
jgi:hypothetical protein